MAASPQTDPAGPDLTVGVPASSLEDGTLLLGHVHGEPVILTRAGGHLYAIGATCTHYGGPLAEGLVVEDTLRCPWHHACFSLRTGEALAAPALDPVPCFTTEERDGTIFVGPRITQYPEASQSAGGATMTPRSIVIVGAGAAGVAAADMLRREGYRGQLHLLDENASYPVDRPNLSKDYLAGHAEEEWVNLRPVEYYAQHDIELIRGARVTRLDPAGHAVETVDGQRFTFDRLLLATGATPVRLRVPGSDLPHVHYLRTLADCQSIIKAVGEAKCVVVIGASFIGLEVAAALRIRGVDVHVVAPEERPLERVLGAELGDLIRLVHESHGVVFHLRESVTAIEADHVRLEHGDVVPAELIVVGVGVRPEIMLAEQAGLAVDKGVLVDEYLESSIPGIFCAGDIAQYPNPQQAAERIRIEHWVVAERQGQAAARNMLGRREAYTAVPFFWSRHYDLSIDYVGYARQWDHMAIDGTPGTRDCKVAYYEGGRLRAVATVARERMSLAAEVDLQQAQEREHQTLTSSKPPSHSLTGIPAHTTAPK